MSVNSSWHLKFLFSRLDKESKKKGKDFFLGRPGSTLPFGNSIFSVTRSNLFMPKCGFFIWYEFWNFYLLLKKVLNVI